ncbi:hypothetical protein B0H19DRAFT_1374522 [Mycena capillaripes]|nr:hypothetical protein B0H19DRAFT_1374522 [Mycena capillaripes]
MPTFARNALSVAIHVASRMPRSMLSCRLRATTLNFVHHKPSIQHSSSKPRMFWTPPVCDDSYPQNADAKVLRDVLEGQVSYTEGIHPVKAEDLLIYYGTGSDARCIAAGNAKDEELLTLASACEEDTGKMDHAKFAAKLDVVTSGILDAIGPSILGSQNTEGKCLRAELSKLRVYGPGSFFKSDEDPAGNTIGSLLVIFPTAYTGGALTLEHGDTTWEFDSAAQLTEFTSQPHVAYVAFSSDVTQAVQPVHSGRQVALAYNLFLVDNDALKLTHRLITAPEHALERTVEETLRKLLADPMFLPEGGLLGFGLTHRYHLPIVPEWYWMHDKRKKLPSRLKPILSLLKGADARVRASAERVGLATHVKMYYPAFGDWEYPDVVADDVVNVEEMRTSINNAEQDGSGSLDGFGVWVKRKKTKYVDPPPVGEASIAVQWIVKPTGLNCVKSPFIAYDYGEYITIAYLDGNAVLFVEIPEFGKGIRAKHKL